MELPKLRREVFNGIAEASGLMPRSVSLAQSKTTRASRNMKYIYIIMYIPVYIYIHIYVIYVCYILIYDIIYIYYYIFICVYIHMLYIYVIYMIIYNYIYICYIFIYSCQRFFCKLLLQLSRSTRLLRTAVVQEHQGFHSCGFAFRALWCNGQLLRASH